MKTTRLLILIALLGAAAGSIWFFALRGTNGAGNLTAYYTKLDGKTLGTLSVSLRPRQPDESAAEHRHNLALYAAVEAVAGPPSGIPAIRFPPGTRVLGVAVSATTATVDLSSEVGEQAGGSFGENGEFKGLVYTLTDVPGIDAVVVTVNGKRLATLPGGHFELDQPLHRSDW